MVPQRTMHANKGGHFTLKTFTFTCYEGLFSLRIGALERDQCCYDAFIKETYNEAVKPKRYLSNP